MCFGIGTQHTEIPDHAGGRISGFHVMTMEATSNEMETGQQFFC